MDCEMPEMDGLETTRAGTGTLKAGAQNAAIPIIALTAHARAVDRERCLRAGMNDYLTKPVDAQDLANALSRWLGAPAAYLSVIGDSRLLPETLLPETRPVFNSEEFLQRLGGKQDLASRMIDQFVAETPRRLAHLRGRIEDCDGCGTSAHAPSIAAMRPPQFPRSLSAIVGQSSGRRWATW